MRPSAGPCRRHPWNLPTRRASQAACFALNEPEDGEPTKEHEILRENLTERDFA